jgi:hypothetical protein
VIPGLLLIGIALWGLAFAIRLKRRAAKHVTWATVPGVIEGSKISWGLFTPHGFISGDVEYAYTHAGRKLRGTKVRSPQVSVNWPGPARRDVARYKPGDTVTVYVDPDDVLNAVLEPGGDPRFLPAAGCFLIVPFVAGVLLLMR